MKRNVSKQKRQLYLEEYSKSGLTKAQFCRINNLRLQTFYSWFRIDKKEGKNKLNFIPLSVKNHTQEIIPSKKKFIDKIILKTSSGISLKLPATISTSWLSALLKELG